MTNSNTISPNVEAHLFNIQKELNEIISNNISVGFQSSFKNFFTVLQNKRNEIAQLQQEDSIQSNEKEKLFESKLSDLQKEFTRFKVANCCK